MSTTQKGADQAAQITTTDIQSAIAHPGTIQINVQGAFIVDDQPRTPNGFLHDSEDFKHDHNDIRLPNHTAVVSHVAVDVSDSLSYRSLETRKLIVGTMFRSADPSQNSFTSHASPASPQTLAAD